MIVSDEDLQSYWSMFHLMALGLFSMQLVWCSFFAYMGLWKSHTLTYSGMRTGLLAKIWGVLYIGFAVAGVIGLWNVVKLLSTAGVTRLWRALWVTFRLPVEMTIVFMAMGVMFGIFSTWGIQYRLKRDRALQRDRERVRTLRLFLLGPAILMVMLGVCWLLALPTGVTVLLFWLLPFVFTPRRAMIAFSLPESGGLAGSD